MNKMNLKEEIESEENEKDKRIKSIEGFIICVTGLHKEITQDDLLDEFEKFGKISNIHMN